MKQKRALGLRILSAAIIVFIAAMDLFFLFRSKSDYSESENRTLQRFPRLSLSALASGKVSRQWEEYVSDQFPLRTSFVRLNSLRERAMGSLESNNILYASDGYLIRRFTEPTEADYAATLDTIAAFTRRYPNVNHTMLLVPSAVTLCHDKLPYGAAGNEEDEYIDRMLRDVRAAGVTCVDVRNELAKSDVQLYYRTDHHWTSEAALLAYRRYATMQGLSHANADYTRLIVADDFRGTLGAGSGFRLGSSDTLAVYLPAQGTDVEYTVTYVDEGYKTSSVFDLSALNRRNKYEIFFGGNHAQIHIEADNDSKRTLLLFKDSYANCFIQYLIPDFRHIFVIDPRYYTGSLDELMETYTVTDVLYLYNASTLATDKALRADLSRKGQTSP